MRGPRSSRGGPWPFLSLHYSQDHGDTFVDRDLPDPEFIDFVNDGKWFYGTTSSGKKMYVSSDAGQTWNEIQRPAQEMLTLGITPEGHLIAEEYANLGYRSKDHGATWSREPGFHNNRIMDFAFTTLPGSHGRQLQVDREPGPDPGEYQPTGVLPGSGCEVHWPHAGRADDALSGRPLESRASAAPSWESRRWPSTMIRGAFSQ
jgi:hypothetical protein